MFNHGPSDRVQIRQVGQLQSPAVCLLCGNGTHREGYVDLDTFYEWEGQMYLCFTCVKQVAELIGCIVPEEAEPFKQLLENTAAENKSLKEQLNVLKPVADAIHTLAGNYSSSGAPGDPDATNQPELDTDPNGPAVNGTTEQPESPESGESTGHSSPSPVKRSDAPSFSI